VRHDYIGSAEYGPPIGCVSVDHRCPVDLIDHPERTTDERTLALSKDIRCGTMRMEVSIVAI